VLHDYRVSKTGIQGMNFEEVHIPFFPNFYLHRTITSSELISIHIYSSVVPVEGSYIIGNIFQDTLYDKIDEATYGM
jgi:hypothetical protein